MKRPNDEVLRGWGEIANYLKLGVRTAQRKAATHGLPVHRSPGAGPREPVFAWRSELDRWQLKPVANEESRASPQVLSALPREAELGLPLLKHIMSMEELTKLYRKDYSMRFEIARSRTGVVAHVEYRYELCNASDEKQPLVQEVTVDDIERGHVESMSLSVGSRSIYNLRKPPISERFVGWAAYRGPTQWIEPSGQQEIYLCQASWVIHRAASDIWYNHMILPTIGLTIETHAPTTFEITPTFSENGLIMKGVHRDIAWRPRTTP
jgi:hypothetical protein